MASRDALRPGRPVGGVSALLALGVVATLAGCRTTKTLTGRVQDFDTRQPIPAAQIRVEQSGWGFDGGLVWDKTYASMATSDATGHFSVRYSVGAAANAIVVADGYSEWRHAYASGDNAEVRLRRRPVNPLRAGQLSVGVNDDGSRFGWSFAEGKTVADVTAADIFPDAIGADGQSVRLMAGERGGIRFRSRRDLGVEGDALIFAPPAPPDGYSPAVTLTFTDADAASDGVYFVRTRDGEHFAKFEVGPGLTTGSGLGVRRSFFFPYVYDPAGGRELPFEHAPVAAIR